jgi:hypothetical protein
MSYQGQGANHQPQPGQQPQGQPHGTALATTALILGIVTIVLAFVPILNLLAVFVGIAALVVGLIAVNRVRSRGKGKALTGAILGGVGTLLSIVLIVVYTVIGVSALVESVESNHPTADSVPPLLITPTAPPELPTAGGPLDPDPAPGSIAERQVFTGEGDDVVVIDLAGRAGVVTFDCPACEGPTVLATDGSAPELVDVEGPWSGQYLIDPSDDDVPTTELTVTATGPWSIVVDDVTSVTPSSDEASGSGDRVVYFAEEFLQAAVTHDGSGLFGLVSYATGAPQVVVDPADDVELDGSVDLGGPGYAQVIADGDWTITPIDPLLQ